MQGFKIKINDKTTINIGAFTSQLFFSCEDASVKLVLTGMDEKRNHLHWSSVELEEGETIQIQVIDLKEIHPPIVKIPEKIEEIKQRYFKLKHELQNKVLLS